ncbi:MAG: tetratricopeptide repeat protein [Deltaproteobacteria bacterium]|nr:tetratricopeptide repeat protein [Deltaproteobacteria bacterium]
MTHRIQRLLVGSTVCAFVVGLSPTAGAARYNKSEVQVKATVQKHTTVVKKKEPKPEDRRRRPAISGEAFRAQLQAKVSRLTDAAIKTLNRLIRITPDDDPEKPDFYFRLAEHYRDKKLQYNFRARELDEQVFSITDGAKKQRLKQRQGLYEKYEKQWMVGAIKLYLNIAQKPQYEKYKRMDQVLYNVADMLNQAKRRDKALIFFRKLIKNYPQSKYIPDAYLSFAEYYFNNNQIPKALTLYQRVGKYPKSPIYGYSVYKQGWCWLNLQNPRKALEKFVTVIRDVKKWGGTKKGKIILIKEAKKDAVRAYAQMGAPDRAWNFFKRIGGSYAMTMLERLAFIYYDQGKFDFSVQVFKKLMALSPKSPKLCKWQYRVMRATLSGKNKRDHVRESQRLAAVFQLAKKRGGLKRSMLAECRSNASGVLRELATTWHREAQKTQNNDTYALAQYVYKEYLKNFPNEPDAYQMSFYYAELLFKLERWSSAAAAYTKVVKMKGGGKYLKEAAYAAVISWKNALNVDEEVSERNRRKTKVKPEDKFKAKTIGRQQQRMMAAFDTYLKYVPQAKERVTIMYRKARIYYENNHFDKAIKIFSYVAMKYPRHRLALYSGNLLLDSLNILKRYEELEHWVYKFLGNKALMRDEELKKSCEVIKRGIARKKLEQYQEKGRYRECGEGYAKLANEYPNDPKWAELAYNAAHCFEAARLIGQAIAIRDALIKVKPKDPLALKALYQVGGNYHALAWYSRAAEYYERFAKQFPGEKEAPIALQDAIIFRLGRAEYDKAVDNVKFFAKTYGKRAKYRNRSAKAVFSLGMIYEQKNDKESIIKFYQNYLRKWGRYGGTDRQILGHVKIARAYWKLSCPVRGVNGACIKQQRVRSKRKIKKRRRGKKRRRRALELKTQCGPETKTKITVFKRNPAKARKAIKHFKAALRLSRRAKVKGGSKEEIARRKQAMKMAVAEAKFHEAERLFERFLEVKFPTGLDFSKSKRNKKKLKKSLKRFAKYLTNKGKLLNNTRLIYQDVIKMKQAHWAIAGAARIGQLYQQFADALYTASVPKTEVPKALRTRDQREEYLLTFTDAYCDALQDKARPAENKAVQGLTFCLNKSTELSWYNTWSGLCERELNQIKPAQFPLATEIRAKPGYLTVRPAAAALQTEIK